MGGPQQSPADCLAFGGISSFISCKKKNKERGNSSSLKKTYAKRITFFLICFTLRNTPSVLTNTQGQR